MESIRLTDQEINNLDPSNVIVTYIQGEDLYSASGDELLEDSGQESLSQALNELLKEMRVDSYEIITTNSCGLLVTIAH